MRVFKLALGSFLMLTPIVAAATYPHGDLWLFLTVLCGTAVGVAVIVTGTWLVVSEID
jgi:hypothetical protein